MFSEYSDSNLHQMISVKSQGYNGKWCQIGLNIDCYRINWYCLQVMKRETLSVETIDL